MNIYADIPSPAQKQALLSAPVYGLDNHGLRNLKRVYWNLPAAALYEEAVFRGEGWIAEEGPFIVHTGKHTARAAADKFVVREASSEEWIWWGSYNRPFAPDAFNMLLARVLGYLQGRDVFVQDCFAGSDPDYRMPVRIITEQAWHSLFARTMFIKPETFEAARNHIPDFTVIAAPGFNASPLIDSTRTETCIILHPAERLGIIAGTCYGGEIKKTVFTVLNALLPFEGVLPMHCSANAGDEGDVAIFFGLSGTGKTTLSADPRRHLIGDDEHGWSDAGVFNFEDGCYAKVIRLSAAAEPQIFACTRRFGTILENVVFDPRTRKLDLGDATLTENTRAAYPLHFIGNALEAKRGGHPANVVFLTCDASGVLPPISRLTPDQAVYHFMSGYTSKIAGTEIGLGVEPVITFSACFGGPFMVHHPHKYAQMLKARILKHGAKVWMVNTGWTGGPFGVGKRISIQHTRALLDAALSGRLDGVEFGRDPVFGVAMPKSCEGVPAAILDPAATWPSREEFEQRRRSLAARFIENFELMAGSEPGARGLEAHGPRL
jgi:phosphoenolpyruvate carboxykinase (ATP)